MIPHINWGFLFYGIFIYMKIIITESKLNQAVIDQLNEMYDIDNIGWEYGSDDMGNEVDYAIEFYVGDYGDDDTIFRWYDKDYWDIDDGGPILTLFQKKKKDDSPILEFENSDDIRILTGYFGDKWKQPAIEWFQDKFKLPVKTII